MTAPIWMALPPEVHSTLLSGGPGPGPLLAAAAEWSSLSTAYAEAADELTELLAALQGGAWEGPSAAQYLAAHGPYLAWLSDSSAKSAAAAALHQTAASTYVTALAAMPTLPELAANHATHAVLVATNFFGINTIPIAVNEADYLRMWVQAADTMTAYQVVADSALAAVPATAPAPQIVAADGEAQAALTDTATDTNPSTSWQDQLAAALSDFTQNVLWPLGNELYPEGWPIPAVPFANALTAELMQIPGMSPTLATALAWFTFHSLMLVWPAVQAVETAIMLSPALLLVVPAVGVAAAATGVTVAVAGAVSAAGVGLPISAPLATVPAPAATAPAPTMTAGTPANAPTAPGTASTVTSTSVPAPGGGPAGGPGAGFGQGVTDGVGMADSLYAVAMSGLSAPTSASSRARRKSAEAAPDEAETPAAAAALTQKRLRSRRRRGAEAKDKGYRYEYLDPESGATAPASDVGAGPVGFAGAASKIRVAEPAGLITLDDEGLSSGPKMPMLPSSWRHDPA
jgi:PPE-repeat protein